MNSDNMCNIPTAAWRVTVVVHSRVMPPESGSLSSLCSRYVSKNIVAADLADRCEIQVSYAIGVAEPTSVSINTFGTGKISDEKVIQLARDNFDLRPYTITNMLDLLHPM